MSVGELLNFYGSVFCLVSCLLFVIVYTAMPVLTGRTRWWSSRVGRLLVTKAASIAGLMAIVVVTYLSDADLEWVRSVRGVFAAVIGVMMVYQCTLVVRLHREKEDPP